MNAPAPMSRFALISARATCFIAFHMPASTPPAAPRRLFTALFPPPAVCAAIDAERQRWPGLPDRLRPDAARMHITLQFFARVDAAQEAAWRDALTALRFEPFDIRLTQAALWRTPGGALVVLLPEASDELLALYQASALLARQVGLPAPLLGYKPHLSVLRHAEHTTLAPLTQPLRWRATHLQLVCSDLGARPPRYQRLGRFGA